MVMWGLVLCQGRKIQTKINLFEPGSWSTFSLRLNLLNLRTYPQNLQLDLQASTKTHATLKRSLSLGTATQPNIIAMFFVLQ